MPLVQHRSRIYDPVEIDVVGVAAAGGDGRTSLTVLLAQAAGEADGAALQAWAAQAIKKRLDGDGEGQHRASALCAARALWSGGPA